MDWNTDWPTRKRKKTGLKKKKKNLSLIFTPATPVLCVASRLCLAYFVLLSLTGSPCFFSLCILSISVKLPVKPLKLREWWKWEKVRGKRVRNWDQKERPGKNTGGKKRERERERDKKMKVIKKNKTSKNIKAQILYSGCYGDHKFQKR